MRVERFPVVIGFVDVSELVTLAECERMALDGVDIRFENGRALLPVYEYCAYEVYK